MRSHTLRLLLVSVLLPLAGCGSLKKMEEQVVQPVKQPVPVKKAPVKKAVSGKKVVAPVAPKPVVYMPSEGGSGGGGGNDGGNDPW